ncbi:MAG TPA: hypothetical protein ENJ36_00890 [Candidatus Bathyarchaeota archaeon]|nr:hypothetical protein [Candidatus Bathyarchaeota archaeon]
MVVTNELIEQLKKEHEPKGEKLYLIKLSPTLQFVVKRVTRDGFLAFTKWARERVRENPEKYTEARLAIEYFTVYPQITDELYSELLPPQETILSEKIAEINGYTEPEVVEL